MCTYAVVAHINLALVTPKESFRGKVMWCACVAKVKLAHVTNPPQDAVVFTMIFSTLVAGVQMAAFGTEALLTGIARFH